jgi:signal peptide peptidase SppA
MIRVLCALEERPWAITAEGMTTIREIVERRIMGHALDRTELDALAARNGKPLENTRRTEVRGSTAIIDVSGPIFRYANLFTEVSRATSVEGLATDLTAAADNPAVDQILLNIDSSGGQVDGVMELADMVRATNAKKPVTAYVDGLAASGAYWIASAASRIVTSESGFLGSIGVVASITDNRAAQERQGVKRYEIVSSQSPFKRPDPATEAGRSQILEVVNSLADLFIGRVAQFRNVSVERVANDFGQGKIVPARQAIAAGMADEISGFEPLVARLAAANASPRAIPIAAGEESMAEPTTTAPAAAEASQPTPAAAAPAVTDRQRIDAILNCEEAKGREQLAQKLALKTDHDLETCRELLRAVPVAAAPPANPFAAAMAAVPNPKVGTGSGDSVDPAQAEAQRILQFVPKDRRVPQVS